MKIPVERKDIKIAPDFKRVIVRFYNPNYHGDEKSRSIIEKVITMSEQEAERALTQTLREFARRHRNITKIFDRHFERVKYLLLDLNVDEFTLSMYKKLLIGAYFTMEYSVESAALFNPSIVEAPDQMDLEEGQMRVIISFRAVGEGHISSIVFRSGVLDWDHNIHFQPLSSRIDQADIVKHVAYERKSFLKKLREMKVSKEVCTLISQALSEVFTYKELQNIVDIILTTHDFDIEKQKNIKEIIWLADFHYDVNFSLDTDISERVIFPVSESESKGVEDARFVKFVDDDGSTTYYATYTAYDGFAILPKLIQTRDFCNFKIMPLHGNGAQNKNLALFPRKIKGRYAMIARIDGQNNFLMYSNKINIWEDPIVIQKPKYPWEFVQLGNCGSPIETSKGWLMITHGVGPMRKYSLGATLLDIDDPSHEIGRLKEPLLAPNPDEREGYVPNVVYSCGSVIHNEELFIPYAMSDYASSFMTVNLELLLEKILSDSKDEVNE